MNIVFATIALLGLLVAVAGLVWQVVSSDLEAWAPMLVVVLVERAVRVLPPAERASRREEWLTEIGELPSQAVISKLIAAWDLRRAAKNLAHGKAAKNRNPLPLWTRSMRSIKAHRADLRLQEWMSGNRLGVDRLLSYLFCLVSYEEHGQSAGATARALGCNGNTIYAGIHHLELLLGEELLSQSRSGSLTRLGSDIANGVRPLIWSRFDDHAGRLTRVDRRQVINSVIDGFSGYPSEKCRIRLPTAASAGLQMRLFDLGPVEDSLSPRPEPIAPVGVDPIQLEPMPTAGEVQPT